MNATFGRRFAVCVAILLGMFAADPGRAGEAEFRFVHPGLLHGRDDLTRWQTAVAQRAEPIFSGFEKLRSHPRSQLAARTHAPVAEIGRNPNVAFSEFDQDATAAYHSALIWAAVRDRAHADRALALVRGWSGAVQRVTGADAALMAGLGPFKLINAAELLRHTDAGWTEADTAVFTAFLRRAILPAVGDFALYANGNWDTACLKTVMAAGVFLDDRELFDRAVRFYLAGAGNGRLTHYVVNAAGQGQESGRDQPHMLLGLGHLAEAAEIAWQQGLDLFAAADHRLLRGFEYSARFALGETVPFEPWLDRTGKYRHRTISALGQGRYRPVFEQLWNHYENRAGVPAPASRRLAEAHRPEGAAVNADHPGFGTFLFSLPAGAANPPAADSSAPPAAPAGLHAAPADGRIALAWAAVRGARTYRVLRRERTADSDTLVARDLPVPAWTDADTAPGRVYLYRVQAENAAGPGPASSPLAAAATLPAGWTTAALGAGAAPGLVAWDGTVFTFEAAGRGEAGTFAGTVLAGDGTLIARFVPQTSSQFSRFGLALRPAAGGAPVAVLLLAPIRGGDSERPVWRAAFGPAGGTATDLPPGLSAYGRLLAPCWLRLTRRGDWIGAAISADGTTWRDAGTAELTSAGPLAAGLFVNSGFDALTTTVRFDSVTLAPAP